MNQRAIIAVIATLLVVTLVVLGLSVIGSPAKARRLESDRILVERLMNLHTQLEHEYQTTGRLPASLADLDPPGPPGPATDERFDVRRDPTTRRFFEYRKLADDQYEICARFAEEGKDNHETYRVYESVPFQDHKAGRHCFTQSVKRLEPPHDVDPRYPPVPIHE